MDETGLDLGSRRVGRRQFLIASAGAGIAAAGLLNHGAIARAQARPLAREGRFAWGVSAGFPASDAITLWTRVGGLQRSSTVTLEVARDSGFDRVVASRRVLADAARDFTVHAHVGGLRPATEHWYRFATAGTHSRVGRFRTLPPADSRQPLKIGFYSCSSYESGYFTALGGLAAERDLDLVLCLGDYIYEHHYYDGPAARRDRTGTNRDGDVQSLGEYRQKYRFYQTDPHLQAMHAAHPFVSIWDDHEVEDNYAGDGPDSKDHDSLKENSGYPRRVPFPARRRHAYRAFFEAMPRLPHRGDPDRIYGSIRLGRMAELYLTDERQYRSPQRCDDAQLAPCPADLLPGATFLGTRQKRWLAGAVPAGRARWNLLASETMMMALDSSPGNHVNQDQWDGYSAERAEILGGFHDRGVRNLVVLSGDLHTFIAGDLTTTGEATGTPVGVELLGGSATSLGLPEETGISADKLDALRRAADPHIVYADFERRGYCVVDVRHDALTGRFKTTDTMRPTSPVETFATFTVADGVPQLHQG